MASLLPTPEPPDPVEGALGHFDHTNWVKASLKALDQGTVHNVGGTAGTLTLDAVTVDDSQTPDALVKLKGDASRGVWSYNGAGVSRWRMLLGDTTAETGSHSGSLFKLLAYGDDGSQRATVLQADRSSGLATVAADPTAALGIATKQYVDNAMPIGTIIMFGGSSLPASMQNTWAVCNGAAHNSNALKAVLGGSDFTPNLASRFIVGTGQGSGLSNYNPGDKSSANLERITLAATESGLPAHGHGTATSGGISADHRHYIQIPSQQSGTMSAQHVHGVAQMAYGPFNGVNQDGDITYRASSNKYLSQVPQATGGASADHTHAIDIPGFMSGYVDSNHTHQVTVPNNTAQAAAASHENRPPYYALIFIIKKA
jgi:hypothetical protein